ncbi:tetratricopeptide repeat protein [Rhodoferax sp.]|uniref:YfgM family protein n=1 Tax=Rhodoferax sp. TaxID=50421 RepID=UPI002625068E|nr:tetratricopeptide repeat protein [Rhodoferax sp.]MDD2810884.1 tetratricopeptide repeat protein [Rhodoferax sp.]MDD4943219.1 tetratricopeptide repeat protein [Rhodoferax sp.]MDD5480835.1 tetratricopeptide repeat protein [Rhodoferax sp.]
MANHLDLEEQEQLDQIKHFWKQYGNAITWVLIAVLGSFASWNTYQYWQRNQAVQAAALFDEMDQAAKTDDVSRIERVFGDMKTGFGSTIYAHQSGLLTAQKLVALGQYDSAKSALTWVADHASDSNYQALAKLRLTAVLIEEKNYDAALTALNAKFPESLQPLVADRMGDVFLLQGKKDKAILEYQKAHRLMDSRMDYRRLIEVKLNALGVEVQTQSPLTTVSVK